MSPTIMSRKRRLRETKAAVRKFQDNLLRAQMEAQQAVARAVGVYDAPKLH
jgi:hypothetical protein